ncbi:MAG TPA: hypothetical protein VKG03_02775 [Solirubrobacterales bacterium]|nr:hypothetical protein [Solirubrobacterales bacterium]
MEAMREKWSDERLDDMNVRMAEGFRRLDADLRDLRVDMSSEFAAVRAEMGAYHRIMLQLSVGTIGTVAVGFLGLIVTQL